MTCRIKTSTVLAPIGYISGVVLGIYLTTKLYLSTSVMTDVGMFVGFSVLLLLILSSFIIPGVIQSLLHPYQTFSLVPEGIQLGKKGLVRFTDIKSYDLPLVDYSNPLRIFLHLRPKKGMPFRITPHFKDREEFVRLSRQFMHEMERQRRMGVIGTPEQKSFWGSRLARTIGFAGLAGEVAILVGALLFQPSLLGMVAFALLVGTPVFLLVAFGGRSQ